MDNNSTGGNDKRSWRDRLGIGTKEMPRIAEEFKAPKAVERTAERTVVRIPEPGSTKLAPRPAQPIVRPAPMAPRPAPKIEAKIVPANSDALAERLKSQREAAEKLAEQRVQAARQKAEQAATQRRLAKETPSSSPDTGRPKFSFTDDADSKQEPLELPALPKRTSARVTTSVSAQRPPAGMSNPLPPPRPALGVDRPPLPPRPLTQQPIAPATNGYRPNEMAGTYVPPPPVFPQRQYTVPPVAPQRPGQPLGQPSARAPLPYPGLGQNGLDMSSQQQGLTDAPNELPPMRPTNRPTLRGPMAGPGGLPPGSYSDDIFEQAPARTQRRLPADVYQNAYRDSEMGYDYEQPRSSGPWVLFLLLLLAGGLAAAGVWFYQTQWKPQAGIPAAATQPTAPVVEPPVEPLKTEPEQATIPDQQQITDPPANGASVVPATTKKQIYDRIVGDREVLGGQMVPTEEVPVVPAAAAPEVVEPMPLESVTPDANQSGDQAPITDDTAPLPLPPPPGQTGTGDQQGAVEPSPTVNPTASEGQTADLSLQQVVEPIEGEAKDVQGLATAAEQVANASGSAAPVEEATAIAPPPATPPATELVATAPIAEEKPDAIAELAKPESSETISDEPVAAAPVTETPVVVPKPVVKTKQVKLAQKKKSVKPVQKARAGNPVVIAPDNNAVADATTGTNVLYGEVPDATPPVPAKKRTLSDLLKGQKQTSEVKNNADNNQVASIVQPAKKPAIAPTQRAAAPAPQPTAGGYVAQLASFRSESEANNEFARVRSRHGAIIGELSPVISPVTIAGSTRYRLAFGPLASREEAGRVCNRLLSAGERDCVAKKN